MKNESLHGDLKDKYTTKNPIYAFLVRNFIKVFQKQLDTYIIKNINTICEVGCGEGELLKILQKKYPSANLFACDISPGAIEEAKENCKGIDIKFSIQDAKNLLKYKNAQFDLVICCEVLEHMVNPELGLQELERITSKNLLISVPNEPIWRILNILRGKYLQRFGNTPGHLNNWNIISFNKFVFKARKLTIIKNIFPFPWQMKLLKKK